MKTVEQLKAEQAEAIAKLEAEHALAAAVPVPPKSVQLTSAGLGHWISYEVDSLWAALDLMARFEPIPFNQYKKTFTRFVPEPLNVGRDAGDYASGPYIAKIDVNQGEGFGPSVQFCFFFRAADQICMARISLRRGYDERFGQYGARFQASPRGGYGSGEMMQERRLVSGEWLANSTLSGMMDKTTKWGTGDRRSAQYGYAINADDESGAWDEARRRLENVAAAMHGERKAES